MQLIRLMYTSMARPDLSYADLTSILRTAVTHNASQSVTGLLCYAGGAFLQVLEGQRADVNRLYNRITRDQRHGACELLRCDEVESRLFAEWSMKLIRADGDMTTDRRDAFLRYADRDTLSPRHLSAAQAHDLFTELAQLERAAHRPRRQSGSRR